MIGIIALLGGAALVAFVIRKRLALVGTITVAAFAIAIAFVVGLAPDASGDVLDLPWRMSELGRLAAVILLTTLALLVLAVWIDEPAYNFFPTALAVGAVVLAVLVLTTPIAIYAALLLGLLVPVGSFTFQVHRNRSAEAAYRHFSFVALGGCLGMAALALAASLPRDQPPATFVLLVVILVVAFALKLAAIPFHTHAALLAAEVPASALALYFGVLVPTTFIAFAQILTLSGLLPAIVQVGKVQDLLLGLGITSALGGAFLATGSTELRRVAVYSVIANLGQSLVGIATLSGPGIVGSLAIALVSGAAATQQLLAAGALERRAGTERPSATTAPLAALAFVIGGFAMIGAPPLVAFPGHFFVELIAYSYSPWFGTALVVATLGVLVAQLRAAMALFQTAPDRWRVERRPIAGVVGAAVFAALLFGGVQPDGFLRPIAAFADEFLRALHPL
ncbi:MAG TPA: proton-conducting transporter membrane subunit [Candidatus Limnocylindria bacterium]|nr:proton-conducting transporter membrane subunit [Candidatus Limnocylindria bacterium]